jgi:hypothetical protein
MKKGWRLKIRIGDEKNQKPRSLYFNEHEMKELDMLIECMIRARLKFTKLVNPEFFDIMLDYQTERIGRIMMEIKDNLSR